MERVTPPEERVALARQHQQENARSYKRNARQRLRLHLLRQWGAIQGSHPATGAAIPKRILVIRPDHLGDLLLATPALHLLRQRFPAAHITALLGPWGKPVLTNNGDVDEILTCPFPGFARRPTSGLLSPYGLLYWLARQLRSQQFDTALVLRFDHWWGAWLAATAGVPRRIGYDIAETRPFLTQAVAYSAGRHEVVQNLALIQSVSAGMAPDVERWQPGEPSLRFEVGAEAERAASEMLAGLAGRRLIAMHPGSGAAVKRWRTGAWAELASRLADQRGTQIIFTGGMDETTLIEPILAALEGDELLARPISLAGRTDLHTLAAIYRRSSLVIGPDSGPLHLAVAMGTPTVHLYGPVDRTAFGPWGAAERHRVLTSDWACVPCNRLDWPVETTQEHGCVRDITVAQVLEAAAELLA